MHDLDLSNAKITFRYTKKLKVVNTNYCDSLNGEFITTYCATTDQYYDPAAGDTRPQGSREKLLPALGGRPLSCQSGADSNPTDGVADSISYMVPFDNADPFLNDDELGCTEPNAPEFDPGATVDDGSCLCNGNECFGCTAAAAYNYSSIATIDDDSCIYIGGSTGIVYPCDGTLSVYYQTYWYDHDFDSLACNTVDDSIYASILYCTGTEASDWDLFTTVDDSDTQCTCTSNDANSPIHTPIANNDHGGISSGDGCGFCKVCPASGDTNSVSTTCTDNQVDTHGSQFTTYCKSTGVNAGTLCDAIQSSGIIMDTSVHYQCTSVGLESVGGTFSGRIWSVNPPVTEELYVGNDFIHWGGDLSDHFTQLDNNDGSVTLTSAGTGVHTSVGSDLSVYIDHTQTYRVQATLDISSISSQKIKVYLGASSGGWQESTSVSFADVGTHQIDVEWTPDNYRELDSGGCAGFGHHCLSLELATSTDKNTIATWTVSNISVTRVDEWLECPNNVCIPAIQGCSDPTAHNYNQSPLNDIYPDNSTGINVNIDDGTCDYGCGETIGDSIADVNASYLNTCCKDNWSTGFDTNVESSTGSGKCDVLAGGAIDGALDPTGAHHNKNECIDVGLNFDDNKSKHVNHRRDGSGTTEYLGAICTEFDYHNDNWITTGTNDNFACMDSTAPITWSSSDPVSDDNDLTLQARNYAYIDGIQENGTDTSALHYGEYCDYGCGLNAGALTDNLNSFSSIIDECCVDKNKTYRCDGDETYRDANNALMCKTYTATTFDGTYTTSGGVSLLANSGQDDCYNLIHTAAADASATTDDWIPAISDGEIIGCSDPNAINYYVQSVCDSACAGSCGISGTSPEDDTIAEMCPTAPLVGACDYGCGEGKGESIKTIPDLVTSLQDHLSPSGNQDTYTNYYNSTTLAIGVGLKECYQGHLDADDINGYGITYKTNYKTSLTIVWMCEDWGPITNTNPSPGYLSGTDVNAQYGHNVKSNDNINCHAIEVDGEWNASISRNWSDNLTYEGEYGYFVHADSDMAISGCTVNAAVNYDHNVSTTQTACSSCPSSQCGSGQGFQSTNPETLNYGACPAISEPPKCDYGCGEGYGTVLGDISMLRECCRSNWSFNSDNVDPDNQWGNDNQACDLLANTTQGSTTNPSIPTGDRVTIWMCNTLAIESWTNDTYHFPYASSDGGTTITSNCSDIDSNISNITLTTGNTNNDYGTAGVHTTYTAAVNWIAASYANDDFGCRDGEHMDGADTTTLHWQPSCNYGCGVIGDTQTVGTQDYINLQDTFATSVSDYAGSQNVYQSKTDHDRYNLIACCEDDAEVTDWKSDGYPQKTSNAYCDDNTEPTEHCVGYLVGQISGSLGYGNYSKDCRNITYQSKTWKSLHYCDMSTEYSGTVVEGDCVDGYTDSNWKARPIEVYGCTDTSADNYSDQTECDNCPMGECGIQSEGFWSQLDISTTTGLGYNCPTIQGRNQGGTDYYSNFDADLINYYKVYEGYQQDIQGACRYNGCPDPNATNWSIVPRAAAEDDTQDSPFMKQRGKVSSGCNDQDAYDYSCCDYQCGRPASTISNIPDFDDLIDEIIQNPPGGAVDYVGSKTPSWYNPNYIGNFWSDISAWTWNNSDTTIFEVSGYTDYKYCKPWEICWDNNFQHHCWGTSSTGVDCNQWTNKPVCENDECSWDHKPLVYVDRPGYVNDDTAWSPYLNHCMYNYGDCIGTLPIYYCENAENLCYNSDNYGTFNVDPNCVGIGNGFCEVLLYTINGDSAIIGDNTGTGPKPGGTGNCMASTDNTNPSYQTSISQGRPAIFACTDTGATNYLCYPNALHEHYGNTSPFIDNNLDPIIWGMYLDGNNINSNRCSSVCEIIDDPTKMVGCYTDTNLFVPKFSSEYQCSLFGYNWFMDTELVGTDEQLCCEKNTIYGDTTIWWDSSNSVCRRGSASAYGAEDTIIKPFDQYGIPDNLVFSNYRGDHIYEVGIETTIQLTWDFVSDFGAPVGYVSDKCQYECGGPWNIQCRDPQWHDCRYIDGIGNRCVGKIDVEDYNLTIDEDQEIQFDLIIKDAINMHDSIAEDVNDIYNIEIDRISDFNYGKILGRHDSEDTRIIYSRVPWIWDRIPHRAQWYYNGWNGQPDKALLVSQEDWYGGHIIKDIVQWNQDRSVFGPDYWDQALEELIPFGEEHLGGICSLGIECTADDETIVVADNQACYEAEGTPGNPVGCATNNDCDIPGASCVEMELWNYFYDFDFELDQRSRFFNFIKLFTPDNWIPPKETLRYTTLLRPGTTYDTCHCPSQCTAEDNSGVCISSTDLVTEDTISQYINENEMLQSCVLESIDTCLPTTNCLNATCASTNIYVDYTFPLGYGSDDMILHTNSTFSSPQATDNIEYNNMIVDYCTNYTDANHYDINENTLGLFLCPGDRIIIEQDNFPLSTAGGLAIPCEINTWNYMAEINRASFEDRWSSALYGGAQYEINLEALFGEGLLANQLPGELIDASNCDPPCADGQFCLYNACIPEDSLLAPSWLGLGSYTINEVGRRKVVPGTDTNDVISVTYLDLNQNSTSDDDLHTGTMFFPDSSICSSQFSHFYGWDIQYDPLNQVWGNETDVVGLGGYYDLYHVRLRRDTTNEMLKTLLFKPYPNMSGNVSFKYTVSRQEEDYYRGVTRTATGTINITINPKEDQPTFDIIQPNYLKSSNLSNESWIFGDGVYIEQTINAPNIIDPLVIPESGYSKTYQQIYGEVASKLIIPTNSDGSIVKQQLILPADTYNIRGYFKNIDDDTVTGNPQVILRKNGWPWTVIGTGIIPTTDTWTELSFTSGNSWQDDMYETYRMGNDGLISHSEYKYYDRYDCQLEAAAGTSGYTIMETDDYGKIRYSACWDGTLWNITTADRSTVTFSISVGNGTFPNGIALGVFGLSIQNSSADENLYLTDEEGIVLPNKFTTEVNTNILFDAYPREDFDGIDISLTSIPSYISGSVERTAVNNIINTTNSNKLGLGDESGNFDIISAGTQIVSYDITTPDPQFNYTGVRIFTNGANRIASFKQSMFVGNTYTFSFYVKSLEERIISPRISYDGIEGASFDEVQYQTIADDSEWVIVDSGNPTIGNYAYCQDDDGFVVDDFDNKDECICGPDNTLDNGVCIDAVFVPIPAEDYTGNNWEMHWQRVAITRTITTNVSLNFLFANRGVWVDDTSTTPTSDLYVWGVQVEIGSSATTYIPELGGRIKMNYKDEDE